MFCYLINVQAVCSALISNNQASLGISRSTGYVKRELFYAVAWSGLMKVLATFLGCGNGWHLVGQTVWRVYGLTVICTQNCSLIELIMGAVCASKVKTVFYNALCFMLCVIESSLNVTFFSCSEVFCEKTMIIFLM